MAKNIATETFSGIPYTSRLIGENTYEVILNGAVATTAVVDGEYVHVSHVDDNDNVATMKTHPYHPDGFEDDYHQAMHGVAAARLSGLFNGQGS